MPSRIISSASSVAASGGSTLGIRLGPVIKAVSVWGTWVMWVKWLRVVFVVWPGWGSARKGDNTWTWTWTLLEREGRMMMRGSVRRS